MGDFLYVAERAGFEPANLCGLHAFQACALSQTTRPLPASSGQIIPEIKTWPARCRSCSFDTRRPSKLSGAPWLIQLPMGRAQSISLEDGFDDPIFTRSEMSASHLFFRCRFALDLGFSLRFWGGSFCRLPCKRKLPAVAFEQPVHEPDDQTKYRNAKQHGERPKETETPASIHA
jgi:hypothetical protein